MKGPLLCCLLFVMGSACAQDSARVAIVPARAKADFKILVNLDARRTVVFDEPVRFFGVRLGAQRDKDILAIGYYGFDNPWIDHSVPLPEVGRDTTDLSSSLSYGALTYERVLFENKHWMLSVPVMAGIGHVEIDYRDTTGVFLPYTKREVWPMEGGVRGAYKVFFWLYLQGGVGYRKVLTDEFLADRVYSGVTWNYGVSLKLGKIYNYARDRIKERRLHHSPEHGSR
ncbi:MAG TPA: hypothetical protein VGE21_04965 [Flavobacteriales bacterium]